MLLSLVVLYFTKVDISNAYLNTIRNLLLVLAIVASKAEFEDSHLRAPSPIIQIDPALLKVPLKVEPNQYISLEYLERFDVNYQGEVYDAQTFLLYVSFENSTCNALIATGDETILTSLPGYVWAFPMMDSIQTELESIGYSLQNILNQSYIHTEGITNCRVNFSDQAQEFFELESSFIDLSLPEVEAEDTSESDKLA